MGQIEPAVKRPKVEEDRGVEQGLRFRRAHPVGKPFLPLLQRQAQGRVAGHDVALAQRETTGIEVGVDIAGKFQKAQLRQFAIHDVGADEDDAVILVGGKGLLVAPLGTERQPCPVDAVEVVPIEIQFDDPTGHGVVQRRDELRDLLRAPPLGEHRQRQLPDILAGVLQHIKAGRRIDRMPDLPQASTLQLEQVTLGNHALEASALIHRQHVADAMHGHRQRGIVGVGRQRQSLRRRGHHRGNWLIERPAGEHDALQNIREGKDPDRLLAGINNHHRPQVAVGHQFDHLANRRFRRDRNRFALDDHRQRRIHRFLFGGALRKLELQLLLRLFEQAGNVLRTEQAEDRTLLGKGKEIVGRQLVAEDILARHVSARSRALRHQRTDGEGLAGTERDRREFDVAGTTAGPHPHLAALQNIKDWRHPHLARQDLRAFRIVCQPDMLGKKAQRLRLHPIKRRVSLQELDACRDQHLRRTVVHACSSIGTKRQAGTNSAGLRDSSCLATR